jgi:hypothetical protein
MDMESDYNWGVLVVGPVDPGNRIHAAKKECKKDPQPIRILLISIFD